MSEVVTVTAPVKKLVPLYEVHTVTGRKVRRTIHKRVPVEGGKPGQTRMETEEVEEVLPVSYMVFFPMGHSVAFDSIEHLREAGLRLNNSALVDTETGDVTDPTGGLSLRELSEAKTRVNTRRRM